VSGYDFFLSFALLGIGHLVGLSVGIAMLIGALIGWGWGIPHFSAMAGDITTAAATLAQKNLEHKGPLRWCWRDRRFGYLDASQTR
jgi:Predicted membrane protein